MNNNSENSIKLNNHNESEMERKILGFVQNIVNGYAQRTNEYLEFIYSENVNADELFSTLNRVRLIHRLYSCSKDIINYYGIKQNSEKYTPLTKEKLLADITELKADTVGALKSIQKAYNESFDIDDESEFQRVQGDLRERRKKYRVFDELLSNWLNSIESYVRIHPHTSFPKTHSPKSALSKLVAETKNTSTIPDSTTSEFNPESEQNSPIKPLLTEQAFLEWLASNGNVTETTARQYISNIHSIEKLYQTVYGIRKNLLTDTDADSAKKMIETLIQNNEYIDANERRHNAFSVALNKYCQFASISIDEAKAPAEKKNYHPPASSEPLVVKTVDFDNPNDCTYYKPCSFTLNDSKYPVKNWRELYTQFLILLYEDNNYYAVLKSVIGKSLYGRRIDFADESYSHYLRSPIKVSKDFFAEGNISAVDIIKRIKILLDLCSIDVDKMVIEYIAHGKNDVNTEDISNRSRPSSNNDIEQSKASTGVESNSPTDTIIQRPREVSADSGYIALRLNGNLVRAYDYSDALNKACEFAIICKPFRMARIGGQGISLNGSSVFYRQTVPLNGYNKLSNGLQIIKVDSLSALQAITQKVQAYCQIDDDMLAIITEQGE